MHQGKTLDSDTWGWKNKQWPRTLIVRQRETGAKSWDATGLTWQGFSQRKMTCRWLELDQYSLSCRTGWKIKTSSSFLFSAIVRRARNLGEEQSSRSKFLMLLANLKIRKFLRTLPS